MAEKKNDNRQEAPKRAAPRKKATVKQLALFALVLALVLLAVLAAAWRDSTGFDVLRRYFSYGAADTGSTQYQFPASGKNRFAALGEGLAVVSDTSVRVLDKSGGEVWSASAAMASPAMAQGGGRAVAYDAGGTELYVLDDSGPLLHLTAEEDEPFLSATLNEKGMLAVTSEKKGLKGIVSVYSEHMSLLFIFNSSERFVVDAWVTNDGKNLAAATLGQEEGVFVSSVVLYDLTKKDPAARYSIPDGLVLAMGQKDSWLAALSDTSLTFATPGGTVSAVYDYKDAYLRDYALEGDGFTALLLNRYQSGNVGRLVTVDTSGEELGSVDVREEVRDMSAAGKYLAVLYTDSLMVYNQDLQVYGSLRGVNASGVLMRPDGSALLLSADSAQVFLP